MFEAAIRNAAQILFWSVLILLVGSSLSYWFLAHLNPTGSEFGSQPLLKPEVLAAAIVQGPVSYTHLTLPTNREV